MQGSKKLNYQSVYSNKKYIEYQPGELNVILSAPHGGTMRPRSIPDRRSSESPARNKASEGRDSSVDNSSIVSSQPLHPSLDALDLGNPIGSPTTVVNVTDGYTKELTVMVADALYTLTGKRPHVILSNLRRSKMDANREIRTAALGIKEAEEAWIAYHRFIQQAKDSVTSTLPGRGLYLDMHGQSHPEGWIELGYTIPGTKLDSKSYKYSDSSIAGLAVHHKKTSSVAFQELLMGAQSFGGILEQKGYKVVPSPENPSPKGAKYYSGGYNTIMHGSKKGGHIDGMQIESPIYLRNETSVRGYALDLAEVIAEYVNLYYR